MTAPTIVLAGAVYLLGASVMGWRIRHEIVAGVREDGWTNGVIAATVVLALWPLLASYLILKWALFREDDE